jgi:5-methylcytosine-specific restriction protein A
MTAWLLTWNPKRTVLGEGWLAGESAKIRQGKNVSWKWSCGNTKSIAPGDRVFMLRQGREPRGVYGTGVVTRGSYRGAHWDGKRGHKAIYVRFKLDKLVDPEKYGCVSLGELQRRCPSSVKWTTQSSGIHVPDDSAPVIDRLLAACFSGVTGVHISQEIEPEASYYEGAGVEVTVNKYERDAGARAACIAKYGAVCSVCQFDFQKTYGSIGEGFIHVHHLVPLSSIRASYCVNPTKDLRPICPNCHAMVHRRSPPYSINRLRKMLPPH